MDKNFDILSALSENSLTYNTVPDTDLQLYVIGYLNVFYTSVNYVDTFWTDAILSFAEF